jgi:hypothetical protein
MIQATTVGGGIWSNDGADRDARKGRSTLAVSAVVRSERTPRLGHPPIANSARLPADVECGDVKGRKLADHGIALALSSQLLEHSARGEHVTSTPGSRTPTVAC